MSTACRQCGRIGLQLTNGRCSLCRHITPAPLWQRMHEADFSSTGARAVRQDIFHAHVVQEPLASALLPIEEVESIIGKMNIGEGRTLTYVQTSSGLIGRYEFPINSENMPSKEEIYNTLSKRESAS